MRHKLRSLFIQDVVREFADFLFRFQQSHVHLASHGRIEYGRHALTHRDSIAVARQYLIMAVNVIESVLGANKDAIAVRTVACISGRLAAYHVCPYAVDVC